MANGKMRARTEEKRNISPIYMSFFALFYAQQGMLANGSTCPTKVRAEDLRRAVQKIKSG